MHSYLNVQTVHIKFLKSILKSLLQIVATRLEMHSWLNVQTVHIKLLQVRVLELSPEVPEVFPPVNLVLIPT